MFTYFRFRRMFVPDTPSEGWAHPDGPLLDWNLLIRKLSENSHIRYFVVSRLKESFYLEYQSTLPLHPSERLLLLEQPRSFHGGGCAINGRVQSIERPGVHFLELPGELCPPCFHSQTPGVAQCCTLVSWCSHVQHGREINSRELMAVVARARKNNWRQTKCHYLLCHTITCLVFYRDCDVTALRASFVGKYGGPAHASCLMMAFFKEIIYDGLSHLSHANNTSSPTLQQQ